MQDIFIKRLLALLEEKNITQVQFAKEIGVSNVTISRYVTGERRPQIDVAIKMANYFNVSLDYLMGISLNKNFTDSKVLDKNLLKLQDFFKKSGFIDKYSIISDKQLKLIEKLITANKDFILNYKEDSDDKAM